LSVLLLGLSVIHPGASSQGQGGVTPAQLAAALKAQKQADAKLTRVESAGRRFRELGAMLLQDETVALIVQLQVAFRPEGEIQTEAERLAQRAAIRQAQDALLAELSGHVVSSRLFDYVPLLAVTVDEAGLEVLNSSPLVTDVGEDISLDVAQTQSPSIPLIGAPNAWNSGHTGEGTTVAILDSGVDQTHSALSGKVVAEACFGTNNPIGPISSLCPNLATNSTAPGSGANCFGFANCGHGTSIAGVVAGVAPGATLISIQVNSRFDNAASCPGGAPCIRTRLSDLIAGLNHVFHLRETTSLKIASANVSLAEGNFTGNCDTNLAKPLIDQLRSVGIATVIASGNREQANVISSPACISSAISVGATGDGVNLPAGQVMPDSSSISILSLLAPGYFNAPVPGVGFNLVSGTSVAAAHVSGAWALIKQPLPNASVSAVLSRLVNNGVDVTDTRNNLTKKRIKVDDALSCLQNVPENRWKGEYFESADLSGDPVMRRDDGGASLDVNFGAGSPSTLCGPGADNFSVRWTRKVSLTTNVHQFTVTADGGVRLYVGGVKKLDLWDGPAGTHTISVLVDGGDREIKLEFREFGGSSRVSLSWTTPCKVDVPADEWRGEYFKDTTNLEGNPLMVRNDGVGFLDKNFDAGSPNSACLIGEDNFSARWTRQVFFGRGHWQFTVGADNGVRLYVDGPERFARWTNTVGTDVVTMEFPTAGSHEIKLEYFEVTGVASVSLSWAPLPPRPPTNLSATAVATTQINLNWTDDSSVEDGFRIERWNGSGYTQIATVGADVRTYVDVAGLAPSTTYSYHVKAFNNVGDSGYSESSATTFPCIYSLSPTSATIVKDGSASSFTVSVGAGCPWSAASNVGWIAITGGASGVGSGTVSFSVQANSGASRTGSISAGGQVFTVTQCGYVISPTSAQFNKLGGSGGFSVSTAPGCSWSVQRGVGTVNLTSISPAIGAVRTGPGNVSYTIGLYGGPTTLLGRLQVHDSIHLIKQCQLIPCP
jgi:subtilisin family serine protease